MNRNSFASLAIASLWFVSSAAHAQFANSVISYAPGSGVASQFTNHNGVVLGAPSQINPFFDAVEPFNPPYGTNQVLSIGSGGSLTVQFASPVFNSASHAYGLDFQIFGNAGFVITNDFDLNTFSWIGTPRTDGSLFGSDATATRVSVSADGVNFFTLNPSLAPTVDSVFPTDGIGDFGLPVNPALTAIDFAGLDIVGVRSLYNGSGGGRGFDISWAQDSNGGSVSLASISFVRVNVLGGNAEIDAFVAVPEPSTVTFALLSGALLFIRRKKS